MILETLLKESYKQYMAIILLTHHFQNATQIKGLQLEHYRYALVIKNDLTSRSKKEMYTFFERARLSHEDDHLKDDLTAVQYHTMCEMKEIEKCISSRQNLAKNYLKNLRDAEVLKKYYPEQHGRKKHPRYYLNPEKEKEINIVIKKYILKNIVIGTINDSEGDTFLSLENQIYKVLNSRKILLKKFSTDCSL